MKNAVGWPCGCGKKFLVTIQSPAGDSENRRNEGAFSPEMSRLGAKGGGAPFVKALENKKISEITLRLNSYNFC
jgi:hypothetical protein